MGLPMILMGDEARRTQRGNNNAYSQDNEISWFDWTLLEKHADMHRFVKLLIARRLVRNLDPELQRKSLSQLLREANKAWHGVKLHQPDWSDSSHSLAFGAELPKEKLLLHLVLNAYSQPLEFELPPAGTNGGNPWHRWIDTALDSPNDIVPWDSAPSFSGRTYRAEARSVVVLYAKVE
jgi:glycogen operon protein